MVKPAEDRAEHDLGHDVRDAVVGVLRGRRVVHREHDAGHDLDDEQEQRGAAEGVGEPGLLRDVAVEESAEYLAAEAFLEPAPGARPFGHVPPRRSAPI